MGSVQLFMDVTLQYSETADTLARSDIKNLGKKRNAMVCHIAEREIVL